MSRGRFNYLNEHLKTEMYGYDEERGNINPYEDHEISELMFDLLNLTYSLDSYLSSDTCREDYIEDKKKFKEKWFKTDREHRIKNIIVEQLELTKKELLEMI